jgi:hypothetical protein
MVHSDGEPQFADGAADPDGPPHVHVMEDLVLGRHRRVVGGVAGMDTERPILHHLDRAADGDVDDGIRG